MMIRFAFEEDLQRQIDLQGMEDLRQQLATAQARAADLDDKLAASTELLAIREEQLQDELARAEAAEAALKRWQKLAAFHSGAYDLCCEDRYVMAAELKLLRRVAEAALEYRQSCRPDEKGVYHWGEWASVAAELDDALAARNAARGQKGE